MGICEGPHGGAAVVRRGVQQFFGVSSDAEGSAGRVREYQLRFSISFRAYDQMQQEYLPAGEIVLLRNLSYDDAQVMAKEQEEILLYQNMRSDAVQQMLRRLNHAKPPQPLP